MSSRGLSISTYSGDFRRGYWGFLNGPEKLSVGSRNGVLAQLLSRMRESAIPSGLGGRGEKKK